MVGGEINIYKGFFSSVIIICWLGKNIYKGFFSFMIIMCSVGK